MFDIGWTELLVIGVVALIVVGPKDLPGMFRALGQFTAKARGMAREFQRAMEEAADQSGMKEVSRDLRDMTSAKKMGLDKLKDSARDLGKMEPETARKRSDSAQKGPETSKLSEERTEKARLIREETAKRAAARRAAEVEAAESSDATAEEHPRKSAGSGTE